jgi:hypothetical protein
VLLSYCAAVLLCCCAAVLLCCCAAVLLCCCAAVLLCCCAAVLLCCCVACVCRLEILAGSTWWSVPSGNVQVAVLVFEHKEMCLKPDQAAVLKRMPGSRGRAAAQVSTALEGQRWLHIHRLADS